MSTISSVEITEFSFAVPDIGLEQAAAGVGNMAYVNGSTLVRPRRGASICNCMRVDRPTAPAYPPSATRTSTRWR